MVNEPFYFCAFEYSTWGCLFEVYSQFRVFHSSYTYILRGWYYRARDLRIIIVIIKIWDEIKEQADEVWSFNYSCRTAGEGWELHAYFSSASPQRARKIDKVKLWIPMDEPNSLHNFGTPVLKASTVKQLLTLNPFPHILIVIGENDKQAPAQDSETLPSLSSASAR